MSHSYNSFYMTYNSRYRKIIKKAFLAVGATVSGAAVVAGSVAGKVATSGSVLGMVLIGA